jgi:hypothetical protein
MMALVVPLAETGTITSGGWGYVIASYVVTWVFLAGYAGSLYLRKPGA